MNEYAELITTFPLFDGFTTNGTKRLIDAGEVKVNAAGQVLFKEGDASDFVLLVLSGELEAFVERGGEGTRDDWHDRSAGIEGATDKGVGKWMPEELMKLAEGKSSQRK